MSLKWTLGGLAVAGCVAVKSISGGSVNALERHQLYPASNNLPDLSKHNNYMARVLTPEVRELGDLIYNVIFLLHFNLKF